ncbi:hypothetical protein LO762_24950 [Actinocorallia sp. API 0066]|uniref:hypothetical protein n=1 Tax=Actinocorallia sp. API 0066 TaxID=2896846 RepID=UPI001E632763|nr:hypothetical protein [Actinocorallia sp. API 0066]MCD0452411.1 hypothetical protein [Actinocorallia sp. API 0066]
MLERRYRALLRCYPAGYRREYGDEILGILLAQARPGQRRPGFREAADIAHGAVTVRLAATGRALDAPRWRDAFAVVSLLGPVLMLALAVRYAVDAAATLPFAVEHAGRPGDVVTWFSLYRSAPIWGAWAVLSVLALCGLRRTAGFGTLAVSGALAVGLLWALSVGPDNVFVYSVNAAVEGVLPLVLAGLVVGGALLGSSGARRGGELLRGVPLWAVIIGAVLLAVVTPRVWAVYSFAGWNHLVSGLFLYGVLLVGLLARRPYGRRACALLLIPFGPLVMMFSPASSVAPLLRAIAAVVAALVLFGAVAAVNRVAERGFRRT